MRLQKLLIFQPVETTTINTKKIMYLHYPNFRDYCLLLNILQMIHPKRNIEL